MKEGKPVRVMVERLRRGEDVLNQLNQIVRENGITAASFNAVGPLRGRMSVFCWERPVLYSLLRRPSRSFVVRRERELEGGLKPVTF